MRTLIIILIIFQFVVAQQFEESHLKCSHSKTAKAMIANYSTATAAQGDYDVNYYDIDLKIDPETQTISGTVGVKGESLISSLDIVELDLYYGLNLESVKNTSNKLFSCLSSISLILSLISSISVFICSSSNEAIKSDTSYSEGLHLRSPPDVSLIEICGFSS